MKIGSFFKGYLILSLVVGIIIGIGSFIHTVQRNMGTKVLENNFPRAEPLVLLLLDNDTSDNDTSYVLSYLSKNFKIVDRNEISTVMKEHKFQESELSSDKKTAELGKFLNANYILRLGKDGINYVLSFTNVNTLEKITIQENILYFKKNQDFSKLYEKDSSKINGTWYFDCLQTGKIKKNKYKKITPFIPVDNPLEPSYSEKERDKYIPKGLEKIIIEDKSCVYNDTETGDVSFNIVSPSFMASKKSGEFGFDFDEDIIDQLYTDANYGKITFRKDKKTYFSGTVFMYEDQLAILVDKKGNNYYFLMFNKE